jgi:hypothetical protein
MDYVLAAVITCNQLNGIINRINSKINLTPQQKTELVAELKNYFKYCKITFQEK